ncbi:Zn-dependent hydrolase [Amphritea sp. 1_MG-2023]|uniref:Zn-dependent hydrolase n=1 Tax=Amphritea sp. 1_MG-2023 TaxID=3062670 RepID=UPI0026E466AA|nr:Zn-dependent hydrolase [Amphritea sp. 1_MG-2023]MDO6564608.1 Zn-dependent hydrolase [Amphritea sp. 1_MG-2023]
MNQMNNETSAVSALTVDQDRLWQSLMEQGKIGETAKGGLNRLALTDLDRQVRTLFIQWCKDAGCEVSIDQIGNIFARRSGRDNTLPPVMTGSHIDTQPTGGKFDGCFGVMSGLEAIRRLNDLKIETEAPIEVVVWTNEEGSRFPPCMMGSGVFTGQFTLEETLATRDSDGVSVDEALQSIGFAGERSVTGHQATAYYEAHIEQGPVLEDEQKTVGVVIGALGQKWFDLRITGVEAHAGPTPMDLRHDAGLATAHVMIFVNQLALKYAPHGRGTVGCLELFPGSRNVIPGQVDLSIDLRHLEGDILEAMVAELKAEIARIEQQFGVTAELKPTADFPPLAFAPACVNAVRNATQALGYSHLDIVSGAGHDAIFMAEIAPAGMIFVPCEGGISHNEMERADAKDLAAGASVLLNALLASAGRVN